MARRQFEPPIEPAPVAIPSIETTIRGDLQLVLPVDLAERIATAIFANDTDPLTIHDASFAICQSEQVALAREAGPQTGPGRSVSIMFANNASICLTNGRF